MAPQISIVLPTYNRPTDVQETLAQIRAHVQVPHEVLILDNSEHPSSWELHDNEHYFFVGRNEGAAARNRGIHQAQAPALLMLDDDSHPLPGSIEAALSALQASPAHVAGLQANVTKPDGEAESTLLPTTLLGCGVLFKSQALHHLPVVYPPTLCFYGEEYFVTLALYHAGYALAPCADLKILHRTSAVGRKRTKIFYHLGRNNAMVWQTFTPTRYLKQVLKDTRRRYEFIADYEGVRHAFDRGLAEALLPDSLFTPLPDDRFRAFSLLDRFDTAARQCHPAPGVVLCGTGKFPGLWARALHTQDIAHVCLADFNPALIGRSFDDGDVLAPEPAVALAQRGYRFLVGHASTADNLRWRQLLDDRQVNSQSVIAITPTTVEPLEKPAPAGLVSQQPSPP